MAEADFKLSVNGCFVVDKNMSQEDRICGALGCTNDAVGTIPHNGKYVWTCRQCAERHGKQVIVE